MAFQLKPTIPSKVFAMPGKPDTLGPVFGGGALFLETGDRIDVDGKPWIQVLFPGSRIEGWLPVASGDIVPDPERPALDEEGFVYATLLAEYEFNADPAIAPNFVFADYVLALAFIESGMTNRAAAEGSDAVGPLQITSAQWEDFITNGKPMSDDFHLGRDWPTAQAYCASYRMHADGKAISAAQPAGGAPIRLTLLDVFHAYLTESPAAALAMRNAPASANNKSPAQVHAALTAAVVTGIFDKLKSLVPETTTAPAKFGALVTFTKSALDAALKKAFDLIAKHAPDQQTGAAAPVAGDVVGDRPPDAAAPASGLNYQAAGVVKPERIKNGDLIVARFAAAGYQAHHQKAAVANAIAESGLNASAASQPPERSFGLFQCNTGGGLGTGFTSAQLSDPDFNIAVILKAVKRTPDFKNATTLSRAVDVFVRQIERPSNPSVQVTKRIAIANKL